MDEAKRLAPEHPANQKTPEKAYAGGHRALVTALAGTGKTLIQTSGSSIVCDDAMGGEPSLAIYADDQPFTPMLHCVPRIEIDRTVRTAGVTQGLRAFVISPSTVYGKGLGMKVESDQLPKIVAKSKELGAGVYIGSGKTIWSNVNINDLVDLYLSALERAPSSSFFFAENDESTFESIARAVSMPLGFEGKTLSWDINDAMSEFGGFARVALATNARLRATNARKLLNWQPSGPSLEQAVEQGL
ncbi:NAD-dependent epimerase/dehydratase family protein [Pseudomonas sp. LB3P25]